MIVAFSAKSQAIVHRSTERLVDIEVPTTNVFSEVAIMNKEEDLHLVAFYLVQDDVVYEFIYRKLWDMESCRAYLKDHLKLMKNAPSVRIVGIDPDLMDLSRYKNSIPKGVTKILKNKIYRRWITSIFLRLQTKNGCKAYMEGDCNPETAFDTGWNAGKVVNWSK